MQLIEDLFSLSDDVRYVAVYLDGELVTASRPGTVGASSSESDKYVEPVQRLVSQHGLQ